MNLSPVPKTPIRTPQAGSSPKSLQLTPIWEEVVKNNRLPPDVNQDLIFKEISVRLEDLEWPVRQHAFRVLYDIISLIANENLDERIVQNNILRKLVINLGHPAPGIRKVALETILKFFKQTSQSEKMLEDFIQYGVVENDVVNSDQAGILRENVTLGTIISLVDVLKPFLITENGGYSVTQSMVIKIVETLSSKMSNPLYRDKCLETLWKIYEMIGESRFYQTLENVPQKKFLLNLMNFRNEKEDVPEKICKMAEENSWSDETKSENSAQNGDSDSFDLDYRPLALEEGNYKDVKNRNDSSEDYSDGTDTETYTKEPAPNDLDDDPANYYQVNRAEISNYMPPSFVAIGNDVTFAEEIEKDKKEEKETERDSSTPSSPRVVLEAEIQLAKNKAITMKVMEDDKDSTAKDNEIDIFPTSPVTEKRFTTDDGELIMKVLHNNEEVEEEEDEKSRTPRRVRFGGEVIKLRTPDSDTTDITIEIHEAEDDNSTKKPPIRELITIKQEKPSKKADEEGKSAVVEPKTCPPSHIPIPLAPPPKSTTGRDVSPLRKVESESSKTSVCRNCLSPKTESFDSLPSSSGSETEMKDKSIDEDDFWLWTDLRLIEENLLKDLKNQENWKIQYQALEQLKVVLINPKTIERMEKIKNPKTLNSLFKYLLVKVPQGNNQQVTALGLSIVSQLIETLPKDVIILHVEDIVQGLCRYVGGCKNINLKIESVQSLKMLFEILEPSSVIDVLVGDNCLFSSSSKLRENSLLAIMYATMTFPSDYFDVNKILEKVTDSAADIRRRVRHASLEAIAILSQFCSSKMLTENIARVAESLSTPTAKTQLIAAIQARLSRRLLPTISNEGLVLYALQIPASRRFGNVGNPMGADVDWILSGTGSVSTGSAKSKSQLNAAQRLDLMKPKAPLSPNKWAQSQRISPLSSPNKTGKPESVENPWTIQKNRTESSAMVNGDGPRSQDGPRFYKTRSMGNLPNSKFSSNDSLVVESKEVLRAVSQEHPERNLRPEDVTWALVPISALEEPHLGRERSNSLWGDSSVDNNPTYISTSFGPLRPLYLKLQPSHEQLILSRSSDDVRRNPHLFGGKKGGERFSQEDFTEIRLLTPTVLREKSPADHLHQNNKIVKNENRGSAETTTRIPVLNSKNVSRVQRTIPTASNSRADRKIPESEETLSPKGQKPPGLNNGSNGFNGSPVFLPSIHGTGHNDGTYRIPKSPVQNKFREVDEMKLQDTMTQLSELLTNSKGVTKTGNRDFYSAKTHGQSEIETIPTGTNSRDKFEEPELYLEDKIENKVLDRGYGKSHPGLHTSVASAPPVISTEPRDQAPSTSSSNSTDFGTLSGSELRLKRLANGTGTIGVPGLFGALDDSNGFPFRNYNTYNPKLKSKKTSVNKNSNKVGINGNSFPDTLKPFDRPKEGLDTCFSQLESQQWEVTMLGLTSLVRLLRHHPAIVLSQLHPIIVALGRQIRNLRSQVARAACQASAEMFVVLKRNVEPDLEELTGPLFHRSADTNRFIRADCNNALDNMADNVGHAKAVSVIISKGTTHQNATVRAVAARLLLRLSEKVGPEKLLSMPKEIREKMLQAGANLLTEGKLETRAFAKQVFRVWSSHPSFSNLILEAVPPNVMRQISKTLISLKC